MSAYLFREATTQKAQARGNAHHHLTVRAGIKVINDGQVHYMYGYSANLSDLAGWLTIVLCCRLGNGIFCSLLLVASY